MVPERPFAGRMTTVFFSDILFNISNARLFWPRYYRVFWTIDNPCLKFRKSLYYAVSPPALGA